MNNQDKSENPHYKPNHLGSKVKTVKVEGHGIVKVRSLQHLREILLSATK